GWAGVRDAGAGAAESAGVDFRGGIMLPFSDHYLGGQATDYLSRPPVEYAVRGANVMRSAQTWPPPDVQYRTWHLQQGPSGSVASLNDGSLATAHPTDEGTTSYDYPDPGWLSGVVECGPAGPAGPVHPGRRSAP